MSLGELGCAPLTTGGTNGPLKCSSQRTNPCDQLAVPACFCISGLGEKVGLIRSMHLPRPRPLSVITALTALPLQSFRTLKLASEVTRATSIEIISFKAQGRKKISIAFVLKCKA